MGAPQMEIIYRLEDELNIEPLKTAKSFPARK